MTDDILLVAFGALTAAKEGDEEYARQDRGRRPRTTTETAVPFFFYSVVGYCISCLTMKPAFKFVSEAVISHYVRTDML